MKLRFYVLILVVFVIGGFFAVVVPSSELDQIAVIVVPDKSEYKVS